MVQGKMAKVGSRHGMFESEVKSKVKKKKEI